MALSSSTTPILGSSANEAVEYGKQGTIAGIGTALVGALTELPLVTGFGIDLALIGALTRGGGALRERAKS